MYTSTMEATRVLWFALLFGFCALITVANIFYDECDGIPTISQTLAMDTFRGLTIGLFTFGIYAFLRVSERAFLFSIICFALAFVINMFEGPITHAELVSIASLVTAVSVLHRIYSCQLLRQESSLMIWTGAWLFLSVVFGIIFYTNYPSDNECISTNWSEYVAFGSLYLSTYVLVYNDHKRKRRNTYNQLEMVVISQKPQQKPPAGPA